MPSSGDPEPEHQSAAFKETLKCRESVNSGHNSPKTHYHDSAYIYTLQTFDPALATLMLENSLSHKVSAELIFLFFDALIINTVAALRLTELEKCWTHLLLLLLLLSIIYCMMVFQHQECPFPYGCITGCDVIYACEQRENQQQKPAGLTH